MTTLPRKAIMGAVAALSIGATMAVSTTEAAAQYRRHHHYHGHRGGWGAPVAAGVIGGLALGALAASGPRYAAPVYGYGGCYLQDRPTYDAWGRFVGYQRVRVCD